ncbi:hypothetical protein AVEN_181723-1 [Araneus ventricosus]|uniref:Uncharacterized protein n=1 Tax=Araneus ventricosus TaxID=182803 RepID=A0A4Y2E9L2_ARAVE|nr:hypothetical protein AVEN_181723-1 [Araneus ventricosus]
MTDRSNHTPPTKEIQQFQPDTDPDHQNSAKNHDALESSGTQNTDESLSKSAYNLIQIGVYLTNKKSGKKDATQPHPKEDVAIAKSYQLISLDLAFYQMSKIPDDPHNSGAFTNTLLAYPR